MRHPTRRSCVRHGFTLIEVLVTVGVVVLLIGLLFPMIGGIRAQAISTQCVNNLRQIWPAIDSYRLSNRDLLPMTDFLPVATESGPEGGLPALLQATFPRESEAWICPADIDPESLVTGTSYYYLPGLLRYSPQVQIPVAQAMIPLALGGGLTQAQLDRQRIQLEARLVTSFYESPAARRFAVLSDSQDRHPIGDRNPRNGVFRDGSVGALPTAEEIEDGAGPPGFGPGASRTCRCCGGSGPRAPRDAAAAPTRRGIIETLLGPTRE
jgi:prepilin-type N-terminal cleavage/methylation domain-containing protein